MASAVESHLAKYRKLVPAIAMINHLADGGRGEIPAPACWRAPLPSLNTWRPTLYASTARAPSTTPQRRKLILRASRMGSPPNGFSARDIRIKEWSGLTESDQITASLELLTDGGWVAPTTVETRGRPYIAYSINPEALR